MAKKTRTIIQVAVTLALIAAGAAGLVILTKSKPPLARKKQEAVLPLVRVIKTEVKPQEIVVRGEGSVSPLHKSVLAAQVKGEVVYLSPSLVNGGSFKKGQALLRTNPLDYELSLALARSQVSEAQTGLQTVREEAAVAKEEWRRFKRSQSPGQPPPLVGKEPQLAEALAKLEAAKAQLAQAELNLKRTEIKAPFNGRVVEKFVDLGQYLKDGSQIASLIGTETAEIVVHLEDADLAWLDVPGFTTHSAEGSPATVVADFAGKTTRWQGRVARAEGQLDSATRLVPIVVQVPKPYSTRPPLAVGMFVRVYIQGKRLAQAISLPRAAMRQGGIVWVVDSEEKLRFRKVQMERYNGDSVLISGGLKQGDRVVLTPLQAVSDGMAVRVTPTGNSGNKPGEGKS